MPEKAPSPRRAAYLRTVRREKRRVRIWQIALVAGFAAPVVLSVLSTGVLVVVAAWETFRPQRA